MPIKPLNRQCIDIAWAQIVQGKTAPNFKQLCALGALDATKVAWEGLRFTHNCALQSIRVVLWPAGQVCIKIKDVWKQMNCSQALVCAPIYLPGLPFAIAGELFANYQSYCQTLTPLCESLADGMNAFVAFIMNPYRSSAAIAEQHLRTGLVKSLDARDLLDPQTWDLANLQVNPETLHFLEFLLTCPYHHRKGPLQNAIQGSASWEGKKSELRAALIQQLVLRENRNCYGSQLWNILKKSCPAQQLDADINTVLTRVIRLHQHPYKQEGIKNCLSLLSKNPMKAVLEDNTSTCWDIVKTDKTLLLGLIDKPHTISINPIHALGQARDILTDIYQMDEDTFTLLADFFAPKNILNITDTDELSQIVEGKIGQYSYWISRMERHFIEIDDLAFCRDLGYQGASELLAFHHLRAFAKILKQLNLREFVTDVTLTDEEFNSICSQLRRFYDLAPELFVKSACAFEKDPNRRCISLAELACHNPRMMTWLKRLPHHQYVPIIGANPKQELLLPPDSYQIRTQLQQILPTPKEFHDFCLHADKGVEIFYNGGELKLFPFSDLKKLFSECKEERFQNLTVHFVDSEDPCFKKTAPSLEKALGADAEVELETGTGTKKIPVHRSVLSQFGFDKKLDEGTLTYEDVRFAYTGVCSLDKAAEICSYVEQYCKPLTYQKIEQDTPKTWDFEIKNRREGDNVSFGVHKALIAGREQSPLAAKLVMQESLFPKNKDTYQLGDVSAILCEIVVKCLYQDYGTLNILFAKCFLEDLQRLKELADELNLPDLLELTDEQIRKGVNVERTVELEKRIDNLSERMESIREEISGCKIN